MTIYCSYDVTRLAAEACCDVKTARKFADPEKRKNLQQTSLRRLLAAEAKLQLQPKPSAVEP